MIKTLLAALAAAFVLAGLAGCNTIRGVGQDVQKAGQAIEGAAKK
jgi:predicted small secreted protein